jgi:N-acetylmuramoyl-L-alanine amidase
MKIGIDPGHKKGYNAGVCNGYFEGTAMYTLATYEKAELEKYKDVEVVITRKLDEMPGLEARAITCRGFDLMISDHSNATAAKTTTNDDVHIYESVSKPRSSLTVKLAKTIADVMNTDYKILQRKNSRGTDYYGILRYPVEQGVRLPLLIEHGYHTNYKQCEWLSKDANLRALAKAKAKVIAEHYNLKLKVAPPAPKPEETTKVAGLVKIVYAGADGVNVRKTPDFGDNIDQVVVYGEVFTVVGETEGFYKLKSGLYLAKNENLVEFIQNKQYLVRVKATALNYRTGPGIENDITGTVKEGEVYTIVEEKDNWGKLKSGAGWISLAYTEKV